MQLSYLIHLHFFAVNNMFNNHSQNDCIKNEMPGCQASMSNGGKCGEVKTLEILKEFQQLYESKINEIKDDCSCTSTRIKIQMLEDWVKDLTEQNTMLVQVVEELEQEASERVSLLEDKLRHSSHTSFEIMKELQDYDVQNSNQSVVLQRLMCFESDVNNLTEFIRRIREEGNWSIEGLHFYNVTKEDLCEVIPTSAKNLSKQQGLEESIETLKCELSKSKARQDEYEREAKLRERLIREQTEQIEKLNDVVERCASNMPDRQKLLEELHELRLHLKLKTEDFDRLEMSVKDMREALTAEVADKHDSVVSLRRECQLLEERCRQADKQTHFKDDIIKEMRKELKQYRSKFDHDRQDKDYEEMKKKVLQLEEKNVALQETITNASTELNILYNLINKYNNEDSEAVNNLKNRINNQLLSENTISTLQMDFENSVAYKEINPEIHFNKIIYLLKSDINNLINCKNDVKIIELNKHFSNIENTMHEIQSKDQLLKTKDEMIDIQNDSLNVAQKELIDLREKLTEIEKERDMRVQEIQNLQQALKINQNTIEELEKALGNSEEKATNIQQTADLYVETISLLENAKLKAENEVEQQRITIGNLQEALVNTKKQLEGVQGHSAAELKEKCDSIHTLCQELDEIQTQYIDCYGENVKLTQTADCLRDANLELKVMNIDLLQDIEDLNRKIMSDKVLISSMEEHIRKILSANELLEGDINYMKDEMGHLSKELKILQELLKMSSSSPVIEEHNLSVTKSLIILQEHSETLVNQLKLTQNQITREIKLNDLNSLKITELYKLLDTKIEELQDTKLKLERSLFQTKEYENKIKEMEQQVSKNDQKTDEIVLTYNSDLICLKQKIDVLNNILTEKSNEILRLHAELSVKSDTINDILKENELAVKDNKKLTQNALNLNEQLDTYKLRCAELNNKYNMCLAELENVNKCENKIHEEFNQEKKMLLDKLEASQAVEINLNSKLKMATDELMKMKSSINQKDEELKNFASAKEEIISLKEEINKITKLRNRVSIDNQKLQDQISTLSINANKYENRNIIISQQLDKCLEELNTLQCSKDKLEERNIQLEAEVGHLQRAFNELHQEMRYKNESVMSLEHELSETKCNRDEICAESRIVVSNVRSWLEEQRHINVALNDSIKEKNVVIEELTMEKNLLLKNIKDVCERYERLTEDLHLCRQYMTNITEYPFNVSKPPTLKNSVYNWGSQNSIGESPINSPVFLEEKNCDFSNEENDGEPDPAKWMRKVQNMSEDLLKSKKYWQTKLSKSTKKIKPVKDAKRTSVKST